MAFRELEHEDGQGHLEKERGIAAGARCCPAVGCSYVQKAAAAALDPSKRGPSSSLSASVVPAGR
jgi:hypothetical protein